MTTLIKVSFKKQNAHCYYVECQNLNSTSLQSHCSFRPHHFSQPRVMSGGVAGLLQQVLPQGLLPLSWGCGQEPRHAGSGPNHLHMFLLVMPSSHLILCYLLLLLLSIFPSIRVFSKELALCIRWPKQWSFSISPFKEYSGLIFRIDWFDLLAIQGTLKSLLQHHSSKASILQCSAFFMAQLSHPYMPTGKIIALTIRTIMGKVMCLLFNGLSRFVIFFFQGVKVS